MDKMISSAEAFRVLSDYYHHRTEVQHDALREALDRVPEVVVNENEYIIREISYPDATIQKVIGELVRCKDCRYYDYPFPDPKESADSYPERWCCLLGMGGAFGKNDYCSHGERRSDDE